ncbi:MAG: hypothetical protein JXQ71_15720 [Verrucomicrobia bacterium]|nr:hypothetical protein [Verrucomicrobiota bacterium]
MRLLTAVILGAALCAPSPALAAQAAAPVRPGGGASRGADAREVHGAAVPTAGGAAIHLDADYPGGNIRVLRREGGTYTLAPDLRDTEGWWFHFNVRLRAPAGLPVTLVFAEKNPLGVRGPAMSTDRGRTWRWLGKAAVRSFAAGGTPCWSFQGSVPPGAAEARFAFAPAYLESHLREWLERHRTNAMLQVAELCRSRKQRPVELLRAGCLEPQKARGVVVLTARHHACESMASYVLEGLLDAVLADDGLGRRWRERWQVLALPFADKDGVEEGDQGKNRAPHDHNRDYSNRPLYPEIAAWMKLGASVGPRVVFSLDLHCPHIRGPWNDRVYIVGSPALAAADREKAFARALERVRRGPIPFRAADGYLPAGVAWNKPGNDAAGRSNGAWARGTFPGARFAGAMEIAYADALGVEVNAHSARAFGRDLAEAILEHVEEAPASSSANPVGPASGLTIPVNPAAPTTP